MKIRVLKFHKINFLKKYVSIMIIIGIYSHLCYKNCLLDLKVYSYQITARGHF